MGDRLLPDLILIIILTLFINDTVYLVISLQQFLSTFVPAIMYL